MMNEHGFEDVLKTVRALDGYHLPWAVCGGWAIDLFLNRRTRPHKDVDFAVLRRDQLVIQEHLLSRGWALEKAAQGKLVPWTPNEWIDLPIHVIWCKNPRASPDFMELLFNEVDEVNFCYRRDPSITLPVEKMIVPSPAGIPILAPQIVLLYKSGKPEDQLAATDFMNVSPRLSRDECSWLAASLRKFNPDHPWLEALQ
jgi:hypothetical protein